MSSPLAKLMSREDFLFQHRRGRPYREKPGNRATVSIQRYFMLEQARMGATFFARVADNWVGTVFLGEAALEMPELGISIPLEAFYQGVDLPHTDTGD
jgi:hypothetical protein